MENFTKEEVVPDVLKETSSAKLTVRMKSMFFKTNLDITHGYYNKRNIINFTSKYLLTSIVPGQGEKRYWLRIIYFFRL